MDSNNILMSNWANAVQSVPENYVFPPSKRPGQNTFPVCQSVPVVDLGLDRAGVVSQILDACRRYGFFQVINHGIEGGLMAETMRVCEEFFGSSAENKARFYSTDIKRKCRLYSSTMNFEKEEVHYWRDNFTHHCNPLDDHQLQLWPDEPPRYREVVGEYSKEVRKFMVRILELMGEGMGLKPGYFSGELCKTELMSVNHHIPCPDPSLTLGMPEHCDPNLISMLHQCSVPGLQVFFNRQWMDVHPIPNALLVIPGIQLKVISNGKFLSPVHRVMTNSKQARTTIGTFLIPSPDILIHPADTKSAVYRAFTYTDFFSGFISNNCDGDATLQFFSV